MSAEFVTKTLSGCSSPANSGSVVTPIKTFRKLLDSLSPLKSVADGITQAQKLKDIYPSLTGISNALSPVKDIHNTLLQVKSVVDKVIPEKQQQAISKPQYSFVNSNVLSPKSGASNVKDRAFEVSLTVFQDVIKAKKENCGWRDALLSGLESATNKELLNEAQRLSQHQVIIPKAPPKSPSFPEVKKPNNSECVLCSRNLSIENSVNLLCGHSLHNKCMNCYRIYFKMENLGAVKCPIEECRKEVPQKILELFKEEDCKHVSPAKLIAD